MLKCGIYESNTSFDERIDGYKSEIIKYKNKNAMLKTVLELNHFSVDDENKYFKYMENETINNNEFIAINEKFINEEKANKDNFLKMFL